MIGGVDAAHGGEQVGGVALDVLAERLAELLRGRLLVVIRPGTLGRAHVLRGSQCLQGFAQHLGLRGRHREPAMGEAFAVVVEPELGLLPCFGFLLLEQLRLVLIGLVGVDGLQDPAAELGELVGVEVRCFLDQVRFGCVTVHRVVEGVDGLGDDDGLLRQDSPSGHRLAGLVMGDQLLGQAGPALGFGAGQAGRHREPDPDGLRTGCAVEVEGLGLGHRTRFDLCQARQVCFEAGDDLGGLRGGERPGGGLSDLVKALREDVEEPQDRVTLGVVEVLGHGSTQAPTTDSPGP